MRGLAFALALAALNAGCGSATILGAHAPNPATNEFYVAADLGPYKRHWGQVSVEVVIPGFRAGPEAIWAPGSDGRSTTRLFGWTRDFGEAVPQGVARVTLFRNSSRIAWRDVALPDFNPEYVPPPFVIESERPPAPPPPPPPPQGGSGGHVVVTPIIVTGGQQQNNANGTAPGPNARGAPCTTCGAELQAGARFCPACGQPAKPAPRTFCQGCGTRIEGAAECPNCGAR